MKIKDLKLVAVTTAAAAILASCGNPQPQVARVCVDQMNRRVPEQECYHSSPLHPFLWYYMARAYSYPGYGYPVYGGGYNRTTVINNIITTSRSTSSMNVSRGGFGGSASAYSSSSVSRGGFGSSAVAHGGGFGSSGG